MFGISFGLFGYSIYRYELPSFEDPLVGFEVRGEQISKRINTWRLLIESTSWNGLLSLYPKLYETEKPPLKPQALPLKANRTGAKKHRKPKPVPVETTTILEISTLEEEDDDRFNSKNHNIQSFFCGRIFEEYVQFVIEPADSGQNLLDLQTLKDVCLLDEVLLRMSQVSGPTVAGFHFRNFCEIKNSNDCCPSWSIPNYIQLLANKTDCHSLDEQDLNQFTSLLSRCAPFYAERYLNDECVDESSHCRNVPEECNSHSNLAYNVFHYLADYRFYSIDQQMMGKSETNKSEKPFLSSTSIFLPMAKSSKLLAYYNSLTSLPASTFTNNTVLSGKISGLAYGGVRVVAVDAGLKHALFSQSLISDLMLALLSALLIHTSLLLFTRSLILTMIVFLTNLASLASAYFIYKTVFDLEFFPFLNLLSLIILIGKFLSM